MIRNRLSTLLVATCFGLGSFGFVAGFTPAVAQDVPDAEYQTEGDQEWDWGEEDAFFEDDADQEAFFEEGTQEDVSDQRGASEPKANWFEAGEYGYDRYGYYDENYEWQSGRAEWFEEWYGESDDWF